VSVLILGATLFYGLPMELMDLFSVAEAVGVYLLFYVIYRFGIGLGSAWAAVSGLILAVETGKMEYLLFDLVATAVCSMLAGVLPFPKIGIVLGFAGTELAAYLGGWSYVLSETGIKAAASAAVVFLFTPASLMTYMDRRVQKGEIYEGSSEWGRMMMDRVGDFGKAFRRMEYTVAGAEAGISFQEIGAVLEDFSTEFDQVVPMRKTMESAVLSELTRKRAVVKSMVMVKNKGEHYELYITLKMPRGRLLTASQVRQILEKHGKMSLRTMDVGRTLVSRDFTLLAFEETPVFHLDKAVRKMSKYQADTSGDGFLLEELRNGQELMLLSDGMGSGKEAAAQSDYLIHTLEDMLLAGFDREFTIKFLNSYLSRQNRGEIFATLDLLLLDCYTGYGRLYKQGAAATFVKRGDWIEVIKSTSLPVGIEEAAECEKSVKKFYENDIIIMVSDGVLEGIIFENKEDYMKELIRNTESVFAEEIAEDIMNGIRNLNGRKLKDDATVLVGVVQKNRKVI
jgi:serine phosphatase RsbU (regulator of sigma subunit)